jgi:NhaP-type Na+/H+ or K+/H+ antiporter
MWQFLGGVVVGLVVGYAIAVHRIAAEKERAESERHFSGP